MKGEKLGLVLEGGGAKGAYHLGVYKALLELGYRINGVAGTSIGALNGALIVQGDWKKMYNFWYNSSNLLAYGISDEDFRKISHFNPEHVLYAASFLGDVIKNHGLDVRKIKQLYADMLNEKKVRRSKMDLGLVTVKLDNLKTVEIFKDQIPNGQLYEYLMASSNFPLFHRDSEYEKKFIDGGIMNNLPLNMLPERGYKKLIAVRTFAIGRTINYRNPDVEVHYIKPSRPLGNMLDFNKKQARENLVLGYLDTYRTMAGYAGDIFCIKPLKEDFSYINKLLNTADENITKAAKVMGYRDINPKRFLLEKLLPQIADYLNLGLNVSYEILIISFFEEIAKSLSIDRDRIYNSEEFINLVKKQFFIEHKNFKKYKSLPRIIHTSSFLTSFLKNDFFYFIMEIFFK